jgi:hypothetical protein
MSTFVCEHGTIFTRRRLPVSKLAKLAASLWLSLLFSGGAPAQTSVVTQHNDIARSGANVGETILTPANVNTATFGRIFTFLAGGGDALVTADLGTMSFPAAGNYAFKFTVTGHNSGSSSYSISFDDFTLTPQ